MAQIEEHIRRLQRLDDLVPERRQPSVLGHHRTVAELVRAHHRGPMEKLIQALLEAVEEFGEVQDDDITIVLLRRLP